MGCLLADDLQDSWRAEVELVEQEVIWVGGLQPDCAERLAREVVNVWRSRWPGRPPGWLRRQRVLVRMTPDGGKLETARITNSPAELRRQIARAGVSPQVVVEATYCGHSGQARSRRGRSAG